MRSLIAKNIAKITPKGLLPVCTKQVNGERISLNTYERREFLERNLTHSINQFLDKYSPLRRYLEFHRKKRLKYSQDQFYKLIGKIALTHAGIEQDLKNTLIVDWEIPELIKHNGKQINLDTLYGKLLRKEFLRLLKIYMAPKCHLDEYKTLCDKFWTLSDKRNETLKAIYAFDRNTAEISMVHEKIHAKHDPSLNYEEFIASWLPKIDISELQELFDALSILRQEFINLRCRIFAEKLQLHSELCSEIGKSYPLYASKNPYLYKANLEQSHNHH